MTTSTDTVLSDASFAQASPGAASSDAASAQASSGVASPGAVSSDAASPDHRSGRARPFTVMAKPVGGLCNLRCEYCYYKTSEPVQLDARAAAYRMSDETLKRFMKQYIKSSADIASGDGAEISFVWHGGEPTLAGLPFYKLAVKTQKRYLPKGMTCRNNIQTNGVLLDDEWCAFIADARFDVGLSIDGASWIHDSYRKDHLGRGTWKAAAGAIERLRAYGVKPDLLCTVNALTASEPLEVYRALRGLNTGWIQFIPIVRRSPEGELTEDSVSARAYGDFLRAVFDEWALHDLGSLDVQLFAETARSRAGGEPGLCWMARTCGRVLIVERDGGVYSCDHFVAPEYRLGDIYSGDLRELADSPRQTRFGDDKLTNLPHECLSCPWLDLCNGGCPKDRIAPAADGGPPRNHLCDGLRSFFAHAAPVVDLIIDRAALRKSPSAVMTELRKRYAEKWTGVGRNDPCPCGSGKKAKNCCWDKRP